MTEYRSPGTTANENCSTLKQIGARGEQQANMLLLGLTGSIATGKSTVSSFLKAPPHNLPIIDADVLAREVVEPGTPGYKAIVDYFASTTPDLLLPADDPLSKGREDGPNGKGRPLNRPALGRRIFGSGDERVKARTVLNRIVHPAVRREMWKQVVCIPMLHVWSLELLSSRKFSSFIISSQATG
jgi:dephospho-CoA kinase